MKEYTIILISAFFIVTFINISNAEDDDIFSEYNSAIQKHADAQNTNVYSAWGNNMSNLGEHGRKKNVLVIKGEGDYANGKVHADGLGNVLVKQGAKINGPIINKTDLKNTTVIIQDSTNRKR